MKTTKYWGKLFGAGLFFIHTLLAIYFYIYILVHNYSGFGWFFFWNIDYPIAQFSYKYLANTSFFQFIFHAGYKMGDSGPNLRAFIIHSVFGGIQWFIIGGAIGIIFGQMMKTIFKIRSNHGVQSDAGQAGAADA